LTEILWAHGLVPPGFQNFDLILISPDPWLSLLFFGALFEEIIFRGLLQPRFIQRYGLYRGIFSRCDRLGGIPLFFPIHILVLQILASC